MSDPLAYSTSDDRTDATNDGGEGPRILTTGVAAVAVMSFLASLVAYPLAPEAMRIRWTLGMGTYYGPEVASKLVVLTVFPAVVGVGAIFGRWAVTRLRRAGMNTRPYDAFAVLATLSILFATQVALVLLNL